MMSASISLLLLIIALFTMCAQNFMAPQRNARKCELAKLPESVTVRKLLMGLFEE